MILNVRLAHGQIGVFSTGKTGVSLRFQVAGEIQQAGGESKSWGFLLVLFFLLFSYESSWKPHIVAGENPLPWALGKCMPCFHHKGDLKFTQSNHIAS